MKYICSYLTSGREDGNGVSESFFYCFLNGFNGAVHAPCEEGDIFTCPFVSDDRVKKIALSIRDKLIEERDKERETIERITELIK